MPSLKLTYFDFHGGRGEVARIALHMAGIAFEDDRVKTADWPTRKPTTPFGALPILWVDGQLVTQSNAINRYVGRLANLYPSDPWQAALCDEAMDVIEDVSYPLAATFGIKDAADLKARRQALASGAFRTALLGLDKRLGERGGEFFADRRLTVADLKVFLWTRHLKSGKLDHIPADLVDQHAPLLGAHFERVRTHAGVLAYYGRFPEFA